MPSTNPSLLRECSQSLERSALVRSYSYCETLTRRQASNFYPAFRVLPPVQRRAMCALYAFLRVADDLSDEPGLPDAKPAPVADWRQRLVLALGGHYSHPLHPALHDAIRVHKIPQGYIHAVLDGVEMDLEPVHFATFVELRRYCYRVASAVGLACIHIWGFTDVQALDLAEKAGIAFQLTNILRDLAEDAARGRVYLPQEDLDRFGYPREQLVRGERNDAYRALMRFQVQRAREYYDAAMPLCRLLPPPGRAVFWVMARTYRGLLNAIEGRDYDVYSSRVRLSSWRKLLLAVRALPLRWDWA
jgi:phytoene synthase